MNLVCLNKQGTSPFQDADFGAAVITVEPESLVLPLYTDSPTLAYVLYGHAYFGLITPLGIPTNVQ